jgi:L-alanine-DL-glutamate epimerase-like enolase superfamily enzyme
MSVIRSVEVLRFAVPLDEVLADAMHGDHTHFELIVARIATEDGLLGTGYTYTGGRGGRAVEAMLRHDLGPWLVGRDAAPVEALHDAMQAHLHYVGRGGVASFAISAADIALWDLRGRREGLPLWRMAGGEGRRCRAYRGGIDLGLPLPGLVAQAEGWLAEGFDALKIKVGLPELACDVRRVAAVRGAVGAGTAFMVDANYALDVPRAIEAARAFAPHDLTWFEEPVAPDDYDGYARIAETTGVPLAQGENLHTMREFGEALGRSRLSFVQPDASNCGGITGWLRVAEMARAEGVPVSSHGMQELHVGLVAGSPGAEWIEVHAFPIDRYTERPLVLEGGRAVASDEPGTGVVFDLGRLEAACA